MGPKRTVVIVVAAANETAVVDKCPNPGIVQRDGVAGDVRADSDSAPQVDNLRVASNILVTRANH